MAHELVSVLARRVNPLARGRGAFESELSELKAPVLGPGVAKSSSL